MNIENLFGKFNVADKWNGDTLSPRAEKISYIFIILAIIFVLAYPFIAGKLPSKEFLIIKILHYIVWIIGLGFASFILLTIVAEILSKIFPYNPEEYFYPNKELLYKDKKDILSHISEVHNLSSIYPYLNLNLISKPYFKLKGEIIVSDDDKKIYTNKEAISLLKEISTLVKEKRIFPDLNNDDLEIVLNHYKNFFTMSESNREIMKLDLESGVIFPKLSEVINFMEKQYLSFSDFLSIRNQILSSNALTRLFYEEFVVTHLKKSGTSYLKENLEEYKNYINLIAEIKDDEGNINLITEMDCAIILIYDVLNEYPEFLKTDDLINLYKYRFNWNQIELIFKDERFNFHNKAQLSLIFCWNSSFEKKLAHIITECQNIDTLNQLSNNSDIRKQVYLISAIISHPLMKDNNYSELINSLLNANWSNYSVLECLLSNKLSQDLGESLYREVQSRSSELKRDEKLLHNSDEVRNSQIRAEKKVEEQARYAREQVESQLRQEQYQRIQAENSTIAAQNSRIAAQNSRIAAESAQQAQRNTERR